MDKREAILARLLVIAEGIEGVKTALRNAEAPQSESRRPAIIILDADEAADSRLDQDTGKPARTSNKVGMTPEIYIMLGDNAENVGTAINLLRARLIKAVLTNDDLKDLCGTNGSIRYQGCATGLAKDRTMAGEMGVAFTFTYVLDPASLVEAGTA